MSDFLCNWQNIIRTGTVLFLASMARWSSASHQRLIGAVHFSAAFRVAKHSVLNIAPSAEKAARFLAALRNWQFNGSIALAA
ncbi:MAG: hypothetical protein LBH85_06415, partial [Treponema sp.]|nr:hypothetical protein [Treponema sp.]